MALEGKLILKKVVEVAAKYGQFMGRDGKGKRIWTGSQNAYKQARAEANGVHLVFNPLPGIINQDSHQAMFFYALHGMDKGVLPFTMRASMTMCVHFEESIGCQGTTEKRIGQRMGKMAGPQSGHVQGQIFHEKFSLMFPLNKRCQRTLMCSSAVCWPGASAIEYS